MTHLARVFLAGLLGGVTTIAVQADDQMYWLDFDNHRVQRANLDGSNVETLIETPEQAPIAIALDVPNGKLYWCCGGDVGGNMVQRANLDGSEVEILAIRPTVVSGLALDRSAGKVYWTSGGNIERADLDGTNVEILVSGQPNTNALALDAGNGKVYWTDIAQPRIRRANLDGTDIEDLATGVAVLFSLALDTANAKIYWVPQVQRLHRTDLDGANAEAIETSLPFLAMDQGMAVDWLNDVIFVGGSNMDSGNGAIARVNWQTLDQEILISGLGDVSGIALAHLEDLSVALVGPQHIVAEAGQPVVLRVEAHGGPPGGREYQWYYEPPDGGKAFEPIADGTGSALTFTWVTAADAGDYFCAVSARHQSAESGAFTLTVDGNVEVAAQSPVGLGLLLAACAAAGAARARRLLRPGPRAHG